MRRPVLALSVAAALLTAAGASSAATTAAVPPVVPSTPVTAPFASPNVTHVGTIPLDGVGVSMKTRTMPDGQVRAFVSGAGGLSIYDATDPRRPELLGHLPFYNWENEDVAVSEDGRTAFLSEFEGTLYLHVVDVSDPTLPRIVGSLVPGGAHTVVCADTPCNYLYGSEGQIFDVRDRTKPTEVAKGWGTQVGVPHGGHNVHQDGQGLWISDTSPLVVFRQAHKPDGTVDPLVVTKITDGKVTKNTAYQHNNIRPDAQEYVTRDRLPQPDGTTALDTSPALRPGELLLGNGETNFGPRCGAGSGAFSTWSMANFDKKATGGMTQLDVLRPIQGTYDNGDPAINEMGCSGHWFTEKDAANGTDVLVTAAWYEHGTRYLRVDRTTGKITQVGFYQPVRGAASGSFWMPTKDGSDVSWTIDYHSGIDILAFDETRPNVTPALSDASWMAKVGVVDGWAKIMRELCSGAVTGTAVPAATHARMHTAVKASFPQLAASAF